MKSRTSKIGPAYDKNTDAMCRDSNLIKCDANGCKEVRINEGFVGYCAMQRRRKISSVNDRETTTKRQASKINSLDWFLFIHLFFLPFSSSWSSLLFLSLGTSLFLPLLLCVSKDVLAFSLYFAICLSLSAERAYPFSLSNTFIIVRVSSFPLPEVIDLFAIPSFHRWSLSVQTLPWNELSHLEPVTSLYPPATQQSKRYVITPSRPISVREASARTNPGRGLESRLQCLWIR